jgi:ABC-2 type transport system ATP-binding protein
MALLQIENLTKRFGEIRAVDDVSFVVNEGEIYGLLGPNGAGKTTTLSMACGLIKPDGGTVRVGGTSFWTDPKKCRKSMGVVPQDIALYEELSGKENLQFWGRLAGLDARAARTRSLDLLELLSLADRGDDAVKKYSGGMKRRINLGCALMHRPSLILLDEPTVGIDPQARAAILDLVRALVSDGVGILYTTHYLEEAEHLCARIGIMDHGKILAEGTQSELRERLGVRNLFVIEGKLESARPEDWHGFLERFRILQRSDAQWTVATEDRFDPAESLKILISLPVTLDNVTLKRPSLNDIFLQFTGRALRD